MKKVILASVVFFSFAVNAFAAVNLNTAIAEQL